MKIIKIPDPLLRQELAPVTKFTPELKDLAATMIKLMHQAEGVGLAANQVGFDQQVFVYGIEAFEDEGIRYPAVPDQAIINPRITVIDPTPIEMDEGCLSIPGIVAPVARATIIRLEAQDLDGNPIIRDISGYEARVVQHETDHLNGILFLDHVTNPTKIRRT